MILGRAWRSWRAWHANQNYHPKSDPVTLTETGALGIAIGLLALLLSRAPPLSAETSDSIFFAGEISCIVGSIAFCFGFSIVLYDRAAEARRAKNPFGPLAL